jgi:hypothetical protein
MKEEWLFPGAVVPVDIETTAALVVEIRRLIDVVGGIVLAQASQEPVLWMMPDGKTANKWALQFYGGQKGKPLYTTPPQRTWVGLTDEEIAEGIKQSWVTEQAFQSAVWWAEAKLKEKNT